MKDWDRFSQEVADRYDIPLGQVQAARDRFRNTDLLCALIEDFERLPGAPEGYAKSTRLSKSKSMATAGDYGNPALYPRGKPEEGKPTGRNPLKHLDQVNLEPIPAGMLIERYVDGRGKLAKPRVLRPEEPTEWEKQALQVAGGDSK